MPTPDNLKTLLSSGKTGAVGESITGYSEYRKMEKGQNIAEYYAEKAGLYDKN